MPTLAWNTTLPPLMRVKYQLAIGALPIGLMFAAFAPLFLGGAWLAEVMGIDIAAPIKGQPNGLWLVGLFLASMVALMIAGYLLGWLVNAAISRVVLGWSPEQVRAVYLRSEVPPHWLKAGSASTADADSKVIAKWDEQRKGGMLRFVLLRGVLAWGGPMLLAMHIVPTLLKGEPFVLQKLLLNVAIWVVGGAAFGAAIWFMSESNYRKLKARR